MTELAQKKCVACEGTTAPFNREEAEVLLKQLKSWTLSGDARWLSKELKFSNFKEALECTDKIGAIAEEEGHHPDIQLSWGKVIVKNSAASRIARRGYSRNVWRNSARAIRQAADREVGKACTGSCCSCHQGFDERSKRNCALWRHLHTIRFEPGHHSGAAESRSIRIEASCAYRSAQIYSRADIRSLA